MWTENHFYGAKTNDVINILKRKTNILSNFYSLNTRNSLDASPLLWGNKIVLKINTIKEFAIKYCYVKSWGKQHFEVSIWLRCESIQSISLRSHYIGIAMKIDAFN